MKRLRSSGTVSILNLSGSVNVLQQITDNLKGLQSDLSQLITEYNAEVYPVLSTLPQGKSESRWNLSDNTINPRINGLDGANLFVDIAASAVKDSGRFWYSISGRSRPKTIKEVFSSLYTDLTTQIDLLRKEINTSNQEIPVSAYNNSISVSNLVEDDVRSIIFDGTSISATASSSGVISVSSLSRHDAYAIHTDTAAEISGLTLKSSPTISDLLVIEDAADSYTKKRITIGTLPIVRAAPSIVVGNVLSGDTSSDCDYLDTGNGNLLRVAILAATDGTDVYIRPGYYNFNLPDGPTGPITIPAGVKVIGAGWRQVIIFPLLTDPRAFTMGAGDSHLEDVFIAELDDASGLIVQTTTGGVIELNRGSVCKNVHISFMANWAGWASNNILVIAGFLVPSSVIQDKVILEDCFVDGVRANLSGGGNSCSAVFHESTEVPLIVRGSSFSGGDYCLLSYGNISVDHSFISLGAGAVSAVRLFGPDASESSIHGSEIVIDGSLIDGYPIESGIVIIGCEKFSITDNKLLATLGGLGTTAISIDSTSYGVINNNRGITDVTGTAGWTTAVDLSATTYYNSVVGNNFFDGGATAAGTYTNIGTGNDLAHNL